MKLIIDIPEEVYKTAKNTNIIQANADMLEKAITNGTPIPDNATVCDIEQITAEIYEYFMTIDGGVHDKSALKCMEIIDTYKAERR